MATTPGSITKKDLALLANKQVLASITEQFRTYVRENLSGLETYALLTGGPSQQPPGSYIFDHKTDPVDDILYAYSKPQIDADGKFLPVSTKAELNPDGTVKGLEKFGAFKDGQRPAQPYIDAVANFIKRLEQKRKNNTPITPEEQALDNAISIYAHLSSIITAQAQIEATSDDDFKLALDIACQELMRALNEFTQLQNAKKSQTAGSQGNNNTTGDTIFKKAKAELSFKNVAKRSLKKVSASIKRIASKKSANPQTKANVFLQLKDTLGKNLPQSANKSTKLNTPDSTNSKLGQ